MSRLVSSLLLCCSVLNLATSALLLRSGRRNSGEFGISCPPLGMSGVSNSRCQPETNGRESPPSPFMWLVQVVSKNYGCILVIG